MEERLGSNWLVADFFTNRYRISGRLDVRHKKLAAQLNDHTTAFLQLENVYISNIETPAEIIASHEIAVLRKGNISAAVVQRQEDGLLREQTYGSYLGTYLRRVFLAVASYEIEGYLRLSGKLDLRTVLTTGTDTFFPVLDGKMGSAVRPGTVFSGGAILVNKEHVGVFFVEEE